MCSFCCLPSCTSALLVLLFINYININPVAWDFLLSPLPSSSPFHIQFVIKPNWFYLRNSSASPNPSLTSLPVIAICGSYPSLEFFAVISELIFLSSLTQSLSSSLPPTCFPHCHIILKTQMSSCGCPLCTGLSSNSLAWHIRLFHNLAFSS